MRAGVSFDSVSNSRWLRDLTQIVGLGLALLVALVVGWPTLRLKGHYLAMATLAIGLTLKVRPAA